jgi:hypothetical protein
MSRFFDRLWRALRNYLGEQDAGEKHGSLHVDELSSYYSSKSQSPKCNRNNHFLSHYPGIPLRLHREETRWDRIL